MYKKKLANEWINWVEQSDSEGAREKEIYPLIKTWLKEVNPNVLVDVGCGQGVCSELVSSKVKYVGVEPSKELLSRARTLYKFPNRRFIRGEAAQIPIEDASVDALMSIWVWSHLENLQSASREIYRVLKPGGAF